MADTSYLRDAMRKVIDTTADATDFNKLDSVAASAADLDVLAGAIAAGVTSGNLQSGVLDEGKILKFTVSSPADAAEHILVALPAKCSVLRAWINVTTADTVPGSTTVDIGTAVGAGGDPNGYIAAGVLSSTGLKDGPIGVLLPDDNTMGGKNLIYQASALSNAVFDVLVQIVEATA